MYEHQSSVVRQSIFHFDIKNTHKICFHFMWSVLDRFRYTTKHELGNIFFSPFIRELLFCKQTDSNVKYGARWLFSRVPISLSLISNQFFSVSIPFLSCVSTLCCGENMCADRFNYYYILLLEEQRTTVVTSIWLRSNTIELVYDVWWVLCQTANTKSHEICAPHTYRLTVRAGVCVRADEEISDMYLIRQSDCNKL